MMGRAKSQRLRDNLLKWDIALKSRKESGIGKALKNPLWGIVTIAKQTSYNSPKGIRVMKADIIIDQGTQKVKRIFSRSFKIL
jgi:hypothetical protein